MIKVLVLLFGLLLVGRAEAYVQNPLSASLNLSDVANVATARTNLGLGTGSAVTFGSLTALVNDPAITTALTPLATFGNSTTITAHTIRINQTGDDTRDVVQSVANVPSGTTLTGVNAFAAYGQNNVSGGGTSANPVMFYGLNTCVVANSQCWYGNGLLSDSLTQGVATTTTGIALIGVELDFGITSPNTAINGFNVQMGSSISQANQPNAFQASPGTSGARAHWGNVLTCSNAATVASGNCIFVGAQALSGANTLSQNIRVGYFDGAGVGQSYVTGVSAGQAFYLQTTAGAGLATFNIDGKITLPQTGSIFLGTDRIVASSGSGNVTFANSNTSVSIGTTTASLTLSGNQYNMSPQPPTGTPAASLCLDASGNIIKKTTAGSCI